MVLSSIYSVSITHLKAFTDKYPTLFLLKPVMMKIMDFKSTLEVFIIFGLFSLPNGCCQVVALPVIDSMEFFESVFFMFFRKSGRARPNFRSRGRGLGPPLRSVPDRKAKSLPSLNCQLCQQVGLKVKMDTISL